MNIPPSFFAQNRVQKEDPVSGSKQGLVLEGFSMAGEIRTVVSAPQMNPVTGKIGRLEELKLNQKKLREAIKAGNFDEVKKIVEMDKEALDFKVFISFSSKGAVTKKEMNLLQYIIFRVPKIPFEMFKYLVEAFPEGILEKNRDGNNLLQIMYYFLSSNLTEEYSKRVKLVEEVAESKITLNNVLEYLSIKDHEIDKICSLILPLIKDLSPNSEGDFSVQMCKYPVFQRIFKRSSSNKVICENVALIRCLAPYMRSQPLADAFLNGLNKKTIITKVNENNLLHNTLSSTWVFNQIADILVHSKDEPFICAVLNDLNSEGLSLLHCASDSTQILTLHFEAMCKNFYYDVNIKSMTGLTPLEYLVDKAENELNLPSKKYRDIVFAIKGLLKYGAHFSEEIKDRTLKIIENSDIEYRIKDEMKANLTECKNKENAEKYKMYPTLRTSIPKKREDARLRQTNEGPEHR